MENESTSAERESDQEQHDRKAKEKADYIKARQERLGDVAAPEKEDEEDKEEE